MANRLRDVVVAQHRRLLTLIDRAEFSLDLGAIRRMERALLTHLDAEERIVYPISEPFFEGARYGQEEHVVLRFALERIAAAETSVDRGTRIRVLRDLFVHHTEREEWVTLQLLETRLDPVKVEDLARRLEEKLTPMPKRRAAAAQSTRRKER